MDTQKQGGLSVSTRCYVTALTVIFALMTAAYSLTLIIPGGAYARIPDANGHLIIDTTAGFTAVDGGIPFYKWLLSPILVLSLTKWEYDLLPFYRVL